ncbi:MAG: hypothetical protein ACOCRA_00095 [Halobacteria archaeon]
MSLDSLRDHVTENRRGMLVDIVFAVVWVTLATVIANALQAPDYARYILMLAGIPAYYALFISLDVLEQQQEN